MSRPIRVLIVDDESLGRERVRRLLEKRSDFELVGECENGVEAVRAIEELSPDLVFLDVQMPGMTGIDVLVEIGPEQMPATIFVTAYDHYALRAFEVAAIDYLVKPFDDERFEQAFRRARLEELYGENHGVRFREAEGGGLIAEIRLPFHTRGDLHTTMVSAIPQAVGYGGSAPPPHPHRRRRAAGPAARRGHGED